jgi:hypothetical protein
MPKLDDKAIAKRLQEVIDDKKLKSERAFALSINADPSYLSKILKVQKTITDSILSALEKKYMVRRDWILHGTGLKYGTNVPRELTESLVNDSSAAYGLDYKEKYIALLEKENAKKDEIITVSLTELVMGQRISQAHLKTLLQITVTETATMQGKDPSKALDAANKVVADTFLVIQKTGTDGSM